MKQFSISVIRLGALLLLCFNVFIFPVHAKTDFKDFGLAETAQQGTLPGSASQQPQTVQTALGTITGSALTFVGVLFLLLMIYAGFLWMTGARGGKDDDITKAKKIITWAIAGLGVIFLSYTIVSFIIRITETASKPPVTTTE